MKLDNEQAFAAFTLTNPPVAISDQGHAQNQPTTSFADVLSAQDVKVRNLASRDAVLAAQAPKEENINKEDLAFIREYGMQAYAEKVKEENIEKLREKLLNNMKLTKEMLAAMTPEQRKTIEDIINTAIKQQLAANSIINNGTDENPIHNLDFDMAQRAPTSPVQAQLLASDPGAGSADIMKDVLEHSQSASDPKGKDETG